MPTRIRSSSLAIPILTALLLSAAPARAQSGGDYVQLLSGDDLSGWVEMAGSGAFTLDNGILFLEHPRNYPNWLRSEKQYENFVLELEYQAVGWAEGGIYLHAPQPGDPVKSGIKIHLRHDALQEGTRSTGAIYDVQAPIAMANETGDGGIFYRLVDRSPDRPTHYEIQIYNVPTATNPTGSIYGIVPAADGGCRSGEWCLMQLVSDGAYSRVLINGTTVAEANDLALPDSGAIAIQNHNHGTIEYKGLRVKPIGV